MRKISVYTAAKWVKSTGILGTWDEPVHLSITLKNNTPLPVIISRICISVKGFFSSTEILNSANSYKISAQGKQEFEFDIAHIGRSYKANKKFTVKAFDIEGHSYESELLSINLLKSIQAQYK